MKIVSDFHDYYDGVRMYYDDDVVYVRKTSELPVDDPKLSFIMMNERIARGMIRSGKFWNLEIRVMSEISKFGRNHLLLVLPEKHTL